jgi:hypothetical protein
MQVGLPNSLSFRTLLINSSDILTNVASGIRSASLTYKTQKNYEVQLTCLLNATRVCEPKENIYKSFFLNVVRPDVNRNTLN